MSSSKKFIAGLIVSSLLSGCLPFQESDLDPRSDISQLLGFALIARALQGEIYGIRMNVRVGGEFPNQSKSIRVTKVAQDYRLDPLNYVDSEQVGIHKGTFLGSVGIFTAEVRELGRYQIDFYDLPSNYEGTIVVDIRTRNQPIPELIDASIPEFYSVEFLPTTKRPGSVAPILNFGFDDVISWLGEYGNKSFYLTEYIANERFYIDSSSNVYLENYLSVFWTSDGRNYQSTLLSEIPVKNTLASNKDFQVSEAIESDGNVYFMVKITDGVVEESMNLVQIPISNPTAYSIRTIAPRNSINVSIEANSFRKVGNFIYYEEDEGGPKEIRREAGVFNNPGSNVNALTGNPDGPLDSFPILSGKQFAPDAIIYQSGNSLLAMTGAGGVVNGGLDLNHTSPIAGGSFTYQTNFFRSFLMDTALGEITPSKLSTLPRPFTFENQIFNDTNSILINKPSVNSTVIFQNISNSTRSIVYVNVFTTGDPPESVDLYYSYPHTNTAPSVFTINSSNFQSIPNYEEQSPNFQELSLVRSKILLIQVPSYNPLVTGPPQKFGRFVKSESVSGLEWSNWEELNLRLDRLPPLPPQE